MGLGVTSVHHRSACSTNTQLPIGVVSTRVQGFDLSGKRPIVSLGGQVHGKSTVTIDAVRTDLERKQVFIQIGSKKNDCGQKGSLDAYQRDVQLSDISTKTGFAKGEVWQVHIVNDCGGILSSQKMSFRGC
jgi:hypothetical protein